MSLRNNIYKLGGKISDGRNQSIIFFASDWGRAIVINGRTRVSKRFDRLQRFLFIHSGLLFFYSVVAATCKRNYRRLQKKRQHENEVRLRMASYEDIKGELRKRINLPENQLRGMTEATGLRILDAVYQTGELLRQHLTDGADKTTQNPDE